MPDPLSNSTIKIAVIGHTNSGKTSLMRTLLRDTGFGEVSEYPGTTRHVEGSALLVDGKPVVELYDTPGLEDSIRLLELIEQTDPGQQADRVDRLQYFVDRHEEFPEFAQEAKVLRQMLECDVSFYVIDVREPVLGKYLDELKIIGLAARPAIPVLNFIRHDSARLAEWKNQLARLGLHAMVDFDTVAFNAEDEKRLYQKVQSLLTDSYDDIQSLIDQRQQQWSSAADAAALGIAELFVSTSSFRMEIDAAPASLQEGVNRTREVVRDAETSTRAYVLGLFRFTEDDVESGELPVDSGQWKMDLFDAALLKEFGIRAGSDAAKGGAIGAGIDVVTGGLSLGLATILGATAGLIWSTARRFGNNLAATVRGHRHLCVSENTLKALWLRQSNLLDALVGRGHASTDKISLEGDNMLPAQWSEWLKRLRNQTHWSTLDRVEVLPDPGREDMIREIADNLRAIPN